MKPFTDLDPLLHSQLRLAIMSLLVSVKEADFSYLQEATNSTNGNLSVQISKLKEAEYIDVKKSFEKNYPKTTCKITKKGLKAFEKYVSAMGNMPKTNTQDKTKERNAINKKLERMRQKPPLSHGNIPLS